MPGNEPPAEPTERPMPALTPRAQAQAEARRAREAAALRENLRRRKQQSRLRSDADLGIEGDSQ